jgi:hypothetical protein
MALCGVDQWRNRAAGVNEEGRAAGLADEIGVGQEVG